MNVCTPISRTSTHAVRFDAGRAIEKLERIRDCDNTSKGARQIALIRLRGVLALVNRAIRQLENYE